MLSTPHVIVGVAIATKIPNPIVAIPLAFCSHFVLEMIPHWNPHLNTEMKTYGKLTNTTLTLIAVDAVLAVGSALYLSSTLAHTNLAMFTMLGSAIAAIAPDLLEAPYFFFHMKNNALSMWLKFQKAIQSDADPVFGVMTQIIVVASALFWIFN